MKICFASHNLNKLSEVRNILGSSFDVLGLNDIGCDEEIPETGVTLDENSLIKADFVRQNYQIDCFADDTGLEVEALGGAPGVYSARYAGNQKDTQANLELLLHNLKTVKNRKARFRTVITLYINNEMLQFEGIVNGSITNSLRKGSAGFGYDPIFIPEGEQRTFAEMSQQEKNLISHRGRAMLKLKAYLDALVLGNK